MRNVLYLRQQIAALIVLLDANIKQKIAKSKLVSKQFCLNLWRIFQIIL